MKTTWITPTLRVAVGITALCVSLLFLADTLFDIVANPTHQAMALRTRVAESLGAQVADLLRTQELRRIPRVLAAARHGNPDLLSAAVRDANGTVVAVQGPHASDWAMARTNQSTLERVVVPIESAQGRWGRVELQYEPLAPAGLAGWLGGRLLWLVVGLPLLGLGLFYVYLRHTLTHLNPMAVVPDRLRDAFDGLSAGVALLDWRGRVVLANAALRETAAADRDRQMHGLPLTEAAQIELAEPAETLPWSRVLKDGQSVRGTRVYIGGGETRKVGIMHCSPILDQRGRIRGCLATVDDVTAIERSNEELRQANAELERSRLHIQTQNQQLIKLATRDSLTGLLNRRAFFDKARRVIERSDQEGSGRAAGCIAVMMLDVDHFKAFNDRHGHAVGDMVLQRVAKHVTGALRLPDVVARYGGEEFCVLAEVQDAAAALELAERVRRAIATRAGTGLLEGVDVTVTASLGVALSAPHSVDLPALLKSADVALYEAKRAGRNRVQLAPHCDAVLKETTVAH